MANKAPSSLQLPLQWHVPDDLVCRYATNMLVQQSEHEFIMWFFEAKMPPIVGTPDEIKTQLEQLGSIRADCVARITVAASRMPEFVKVLEDSLKKRASHKEGPR